MPPKPKGGARCIAWVFRASVELPFDKNEAYELQGILLEFCESFIFQVEAAPETGYLHYQGAMWLLNRNRYAWIQKNIRHFEYLMPKSKNSTPKQAWTYGSKEDTRVKGPWSSGEPPLDPERQSREEWVSFINESKKGNFAKIEEDLPSKYVIYYGTMKRINNDTPLTPPDLLARCGEWFWGPPMSGKTEAAMAFGPFYMKGPNSTWDGYNQEPTVIVDDLDESHFYLQHHLKIWGDKYAFQGKVLYSHIKLRPERIIVTSNVRICDVFKNPLHAAAIRSRFPEREFIHDPLRGLSGHQLAQRSQEILAVANSRFNLNFVM